MEVYVPCGLDNEDVLNEARQVMSTIKTEAHEENDMKVAPFAPRKQDEQDQTSQPARETEAPPAKTEEDDGTN